MHKLDPRLHAFREDLADERLRGKVEAARFVAGVARQIVMPVVAVLSAVHGGRSKDRDARSARMGLLQLVAGT